MLDTVTIQEKVDATTNDVAFGESVTAFNDGLGTLSEKVFMMSNGKQVNQKHQSVVEYKNKWRAGKTAEEARMKLHRQANGTYMTPERIKRIEQVLKDNKAKFDQHKTDKKNEKEVADPVYEFPERQEPFREISDDEYQDLVARQKCMNDIKCNAGSWKTEVDQEKYLTDKSKEDAAFAKKAAAEKAALEAKQAENPA